MHQMQKNTMEFSMSAYLRHPNKRANSVDSSGHLFFPKKKKLIQKTNLKDRKIIKWECLKWRVWVQQPILVEVEGTERVKQINVPLAMCREHTDEPQALWQTWIIKYTVHIHYLSHQTTCWVRNHSVIKGPVCWISGDLLAGIGYHIY